MPSETSRKSLCDVIYEIYMIICISECVKKEDFLKTHNIGKSLSKKKSIDWEVGDRRHIQVYAQIENREYRQCTTTEIQIQNELCRILSPRSEDLAPPLPG